MHETPDPDGARDRRRLRRVAALIAAAGALSAVAAEVLTGYRFYVATIERQFQANPMAELARGMSDDFAPISLKRFITTRIHDRGGWFFVDAFLTVAASVATSWLMRPPAPASAEQPVNPDKPDPAL